VRRILALLLLSAACAGDLPPPPPSTASAVLAPRPEILAAGTGALTPLAMALAREVWTGTGLRIRVEPSIGSGGGISATRDGAVDLGLVSRPLRPEESAGLERVDLARDAVVLAAAADFPHDDLSSAEVHRLYRGELRGLILLLREETESANAAFESTLPGLTDERRSSAASGRFRVLDHDDAMALARGTWPAVRTLGVVFRPERRDRVAPFLALASSERGRALIRSLGYLPMESRR